MGRTVSKQGPEGCTKLWHVGSGLRGLGIRGFGCRSLGNSVLGLRLRVQLEA